MRLREKHGKMEAMDSGWHIVRDSGYCDGKPHIDGHRIKVQHVAIWHERLGKSPDEIIAEHPGLTLAEVYAALSYYHAHRQEIEADMKADEQLVARLMEQSAPSRLLQRISAGHAAHDPLSSG